MGEHDCMGANLARLELRVMLRELVTRFRDIEPTSTIERLRSSSTGGVKALPIRYRLEPGQEEERA